MKLLSVAVPCYNSEAYMTKAIETLLVGGNEMEIIIVNDGSSDKTIQIARDYEEMYPKIIRVVDQENKGHGGAVNAGLAVATGRYFRVVDSDDWVREESLIEVLKEIRNLHESNHEVDLILTNFVYEKTGKKHKKVMRYANALQERVILGWEDISRLRVSQYILMHSVTYRTELLKECGLQLPEHTFYVDNLFVYVPMKDVRTIYYIDTNLYRYYIGRDDQSVNEKIMCSRIDQQLRVNRLMIEAFDPSKLPIKSQRNYLIQYLSIITTVSSVLLNRIGDDEARRKKEELWNFLREKYPALYRRIKRTIFGRVSTMDSKIGVKASLAIYKLTRKIYGFN